MDLLAVAAKFNRICKGSIYAFCGTEQISGLVDSFRQHGMTTRVGVWEKTNPSPMNGTRLWISGLEFCVFARKPNATFNEHCKKALWQAPSLCVVSAGVADANTAARAALYVQNVLRREYDLMAD